MAFSLRRANRAQPARGTLRIHTPKRRSVTASAVSVGVQDRESAARNQAPIGQTTGRIERALGYYDTLGEVWYPAQFYARAMKRIRFYPAVLDDTGEPQEIEDGPVRELFDRMHDAGGTTIRDLASNYGRLRFLIADGSLIVSEQDGEEVWEYLSPLELKMKRNTDPQEYERDNGIEKRTYVEAGELDNVGGDLARVWRLWRRHPAKSGWSDAPVLSVLSLYALLERMTLAAGATSGNRAALRDLIYIPDELTLANEEDPGVDEDPLADKLVAEIIDAMTTAIRDPESVESIAPLILRGPATVETPTGVLPMAQAIARIQLGRDNPYFEADSWDKVIERIALGLDMPNEMLTGTGKVNHWGGWLLDEQGFRQHVAGVVEEFCDDLGSAYLRPAAIAEGTIKDADRVIVWYDPVAAIAHPDEGPTAKDAWENGAVGREFYRAAIGAGDEDAPTPEDEAFLLELKGRRPAQDPAADGETAPQDGGTGGDTTEAPPATEPSSSSGDQPAASASALRAAMIVGAAEMQVKQARKVAGSRLVRRSQSCDECKDSIRGVESETVAATLGQPRVLEIIDGHTTESALVAGAGGLLAAQMREWGIAGDWPDELGKLVEAHALRTLYVPKAPPLPSGFAASVAKALR